MLRAAGSELRKSWYCRAAQEDHFPGCQSEVIPAVVPGAPNFRGVPGFNVYGVSLPTVEGIKATLAHVGAAPGTTDKHGNEVCHGARCSHALTGRGKSLSWA